MYYINSFYMKLFVMSSLLKLGGSSKPPALHLANLCEESESTQAQTRRSTGHRTVSYRNRVVTT